MNHNPDESQSEIFYRSVSVDELIAIRQAGGLALMQAELFVTQDLEWVENYVRRSKAGPYDYILAITTKPGTLDWMLSVGKRHAGSKAAQEEFSFLPILRKGDRNAVHVKIQDEVVTYGLRAGTIDGFNARIQKIEIVCALT